MTTATATATATVQTVATPDGPFTIVSDEDERVLASGWTSDVADLIVRAHASLRPAQLVTGTTGAADAVAAYYSGDVAAITAVPVRQHGTALQVQGWAALRRIEPGAPLSYTGFATLLGKPTAARVAASICARNAPALFVPCHRVLRNDGSLGGFAWGTPVKEALLERERA
ncbi:putative methylated-DNA:protein-cysteine methyltransferase [Leucobacter sp. Psy1]|uniref:methylated-DNA--[protein]-cysteine S-methyltransferase n=1 Tax=Leucobacter sp. Psy1 TaxID=2875729 RepID=UPI001CD3F062|nr:methylated-DNA--[protein]-cysteine S-methyltransferase [Leucobacter sp. Psy1]UBH05499.1 putative methylated-DNA:protein-cysteine methyltransferase [Leucobacter sp. Psy1]